MDKSLFRVAAWGLGFVGAVVLGAGIATFVVRTQVQQPVVYDWDSTQNPDNGQGNVEIDTSDGYPETQNGDASGSSTSDIVSDDQE